MRPDPIRDHRVFNDVLYAQCWEDPALDQAAFRLCPDDVVFTITSGGCNALAFLLDDPATVIALDLNPHQNHVLELKCAAIRSLSYGSLLELMGVIPSSTRGALYERLRPSLSDDARRFWDGHPGHIGRGIIHCGTFEGYIRLLGGMTRAIVGRRALWAFFEAQSREERSVLYSRHWDTVSWKAFTRVFLSRSFMSLFFDKAFFEQLEDDFSFGRHFEEIIRHALIELSPRKSSFLSFALLGRYYGHSSLPAYLREENVATIRNRLDRIRLVSDDCASFFRQQPESSISRFNFTNIFEWMPVAGYEALLHETVRVATDGAVMTYRNLLVPRSHPSSFDGTIRSRDDEARLLHRNDLSFLYRAYIIEEIHKRKDHHVARRQARAVPR